MAPRVDYVGEHHGRSAEDVVFQLDTRIHRHIILNFYVVADHHTGTYHHILSEIARLPDACTGHDVRKMPDDGAVAYFAAFVNHRGGMGLVSWGEACRSTEVHRPSLCQLRLLACFQHLQNAHAALGIGARPATRGETLQKMLALQT